MVAFVAPSFVPLCVCSWGEAEVFVLSLLPARAIGRIREEFWHELRGGKLFFGSLPGDTALEATAGTGRGGEAELL